MNVGDFWEKFCDINFERCLNLCQTYWGEIDRILRLLRSVYEVIYI